VIRLIAVGKLKDHHLAALVDDYRRRLRPHVRLEVTELRDQGPEREEKAILAAAGGGGTGGQLVVLDERGDALTSVELADLVGRHGSLTFVIGGPDGLTGTVRARADRLVRLSRMTLTHEWARALLCEQLYRAVSIQRGLPYHRG
jgi:23S rRNA (pseudouridine1915-N3)-methyltransferase